MALDQSGFLTALQEVKLAEWPQLQLLRCRFDKTRYQDQLFAHYAVKLPPQIQAAVVKRKAEFLAGRFLSAQLLQSQGQASEIGIGCHRQPLWPAGWCGSITHSGEIAISCIAPQSEVALLGIDIEAWMTPELAAEIGESIINQQERQLLAAPWPFARALSLAFSAKESVFKACYPLVGRYFDFDCAQVIAVNYITHSISLQLTQDLAPALPEGKVLQARFSHDADSVFTVVCQLAENAML